MAETNTNEVETVKFKLIESGKDDGKSKELPQIKYEKRWKLAVIILAVVTIILLTTLLAITIVWRQVRIKSLSPRQQDVCVPSDHLKVAESNSDNHLDVFTKAFNEDKNTSMWCGKASDVLDWLVKKQAEEQFRQGSASRLLSMKIPKCVAEKPPKTTSVRVSGISLNDMQGKPDAGVLHWNATVSSPDDEFQYSDGQLSVSKPGYYYIFSQLKLKTKTVSDDEAADTTSGSNTDLIHTHQVYLLNLTDNSVKTILESSKSRCSVNGEGETTSAVGAVFHLTKTDKLIVKTSHPQHLIPCEHSNFFGMYLS